MLELGDHVVQIAVHHQIERVVAKLYPRVARDRVDALRARRGDELMHVRGRAQVRRRQPFAQRRQVGAEPVGRVGAAPDQPPVQVEGQQRAVRLH